MKNKYLEEFNEIKGSEFTFPNIDVINKKQDRYSMCFKYSFAVPNQEALDTIAKYSPIVEIGAGNGYWAYLLQQIGVNIVPYDDFSWDSFKDPYTTITKGDETTLLSYPRHWNLFLCWSDYNRDFAYNCLKNFNGKYLIYIGENSGGCTCNDAFFNYLDKNFKQIEYVKIPQWAGLHDYLAIYERLVNSEN